MHYSENRAADAALALKNTGTGLGTENSTATIDHPELYYELQKTSFIWYQVMKNRLYEAVIQCFEAAFRYSEAVFHCSRVENHYFVEAHSVAYY